MLFNRLFKDTCAANDLRFLDIWNDVTVDNLLNPTFHVDGTHLGVESAQITLRKLMEHVITDDRPAMAQRYDYARDAARSSFREEHDGCNEPIRAPISVPGWS